MKLSRVAQKIDPKTRLCVTVPRGLLARAKARAGNSGFTLSAIVVAAFKQFLKE
jgi:hypothetical protein